MPKLTSSTDWTGPLDDQRRPGAFTHQVGQFSITSDYQRILESERAAALIPPDVRRVMGFAWALLVLSPLVLWLARLIVGMIARAELVQDNRHVLILWGLGAISLAVWQVVSRSRALIAIRKAFLTIALIATIVVAVAYVYVGFGAYAHATPSAPERTYEWYQTSGRSPFQRVVTFHQRPDGTTVEGADSGRPFAYGTTCALVQRLDGDYGFSWVRVLDRSRLAGRGQLSWPVRREECFSMIPLSRLPR